MHVISAPLRWSIDVPVPSRCFISHILLYKLIFVNNITRQAVKHLSSYANYMSFLNTTIMALSYHYNGIAWCQGIKQTKETIIYYILLCDRTISGIINKMLHQNYNGSPLQWKNKEGRRDIQLILSFIIGIQ